MPRGGWRASVGAAARARRPFGKLRACSLDSRQDALTLPAAIVLVEDCSVEVRLKYGSKLETKSIRTPVVAGGVLDMFIWTKVWSERKGYTRLVNLIRSHRLTVPKGES
jgi:hypothetical protein